MARTPKEFQAFTSLVDRLLTVPKAELDRRMMAYREEADKNPNKPGPKPGKRRVKSASRASGASTASRSRP
jgi:hypothetical protein